MDCACTELLQSLFVGTTALFAGMGLTISLVAAPATLESSDPLPAFKKLYNNGKRIAFATVLPSAVTGYLLYSRLNDSRYLVSGVLNLLVIPWTAQVMMPTNKILLNMKSDESHKAKDLIEYWAKCQWGRTILGITAFAIGVQAILFKKG